MGARLELRHGIVPDTDRIATSADTLAVEVPVIGSKIRSKGNLYLLVTAPAGSQRALEATRTVAESIRRDYYYDESAGIPVCLEKAIRTANRRLRSMRDPLGTEGTVGLAAAVVRQGELYVTAIGDADAYLVRAARLLMPDQAGSPGLPAEEGLRIDVWRGELVVGDAILLVARNLTETVGTEELKNAVVTLDPQSAAEHLHHLFVAAGGDGPDGVLVVEATEPSASRTERRPLPPPGRTDAYAELPGGPLPGVDTVAGAAGAVTGAVSGIGERLSGAVAAVADRMLGAMPRRSTSARRVAPSVAGRERRRRIASALLSFLVVVLVLGIGIWVFPQGKEDPVVSYSTGERAWLDAKEQADRGTSLLDTDRDAALTACQDAWASIGRARDGGVGEDVLADVTQVTSDCLDEVHNIRRLRAQLLASTEGMEPTSLVRGPEGDPYFIDRTGQAVWRVDPRTGKGSIEVKEGDGSGRVIVAEPRFLATGGVDLVMLDNKGTIWRWRTAGTGTLIELRKPDDPVLGDNVTILKTYLTDPAANLYYVYAADPTAAQIHRYQLAGDGIGFSEADGYLVAQNEDVGLFRDIFVSTSLYTLDGDQVVRHYQGRVQDDFKLATPPDDGDIHPGHDYRFLTGTDDRFYIYDAKWDRIVVFDKETGAYREQWQSAAKVPPLEDLRGFYIEPSGRDRVPPDLFWITTTGLYRSPLDDDPGGKLTTAETPPPRRTPAPEKTKKPGRRGKADDQQQVTEASPSPAPSPAG